MGLAGLHVLVFPYDPYGLLLMPLLHRAQVLEEPARNFRGHERVM